MAVSSGKIGFAYLIDGELMDWKLSMEASRSEEAAFEQASEWIGYYRLDLLVLEEPRASRKGPHAHTLHTAIARAARMLNVEVALVAHVSASSNKYDEAAVVAEEFPQIAAWLPEKRRLWEKEPRNIILFEALALAWSWWRASGPKDVETIDW